MGRPNSSSRGRVMSPRISPPPTTPGSDHDQQDSNMQQFYNELLSEFRKVGEAISGLADRMGRVETNVTHILKRQEETNHLDERVDQLDKRITVVEEAAKTSS